MDLSDKVQMKIFKDYLYADLMRQFELEGRPVAKIGVLAIAKRVLHPRFFPIVLCRFSRGALLAGIPAVPQLLTLANLVLFGLEVTPRCEIGPGVLFPHTVGTVIGAWRIGANVTIFQNVTVGARSLDMGFTVSLRPEIGNGVTLGAGCKVLGGVVIGDNVTIRANSVVLESLESKAGARKLCD